MHIVQMIKSSQCFLFVRIHRKFILQFHSENSNEIAFPLCEISFPGQRRRRRRKNVSSETSSFHFGYAESCCALQFQCCDAETSTLTDMKPSAKFTRANMTSRSRVCQNIWTTAQHRTQSETNNIFLVKVEANILQRFFSRSIAIWVFQYWNSSAKLSWTSAIRLFEVTRYAVSSKWWPNQKPYVR